MSATTPEYTHLKINGSLGVVPITPGDIEGKSLDVYILMGGTGSGKSSFIELLSPDKNLGISKDSLESVTQEVVCYQIINMTVGKGRWTVILMDTPGFRDPKMSESRIMAKITDALDSLRKSASRVAVYIFYFHPITDIRMAGTKRESVKLLKSFAESFEASGITVITTLWNRINGQRVEDAHRRLRSLADEIFVSDELRITVTKCDYSKDSPLSILDTAHGGWLHERETSHTRDLKYQSLIRDNLVCRINNAQQHLQNLADEKRNATAFGREDPVLLQFVHREERQVSDALESFAYDLRILGPTVYLSVFPDLDVPIPQHPLPHPLPLPETRSQDLATSQHAVHTAQTYKSLKINGPLSVVPVTSEDVKGEVLFVDVLMGPRGSGKSTFIESLSPEQELGISKDALESVTPHVTCYRVLNLGHQVYNTNHILMDTPGVLDPRLPESRIVTMITQTLDDLRHSAAMVFASVFYFQTITELRIDGSKRIELQMLKTYSGLLEDMAVTLVTTMWNRISTPKQMENANRQFSSLSNEFCPRSDRRPIKVTKFEFSRDSALLILDGVRGRCRHMENTSQNMDPQYQFLILNNLLSRIATTLQQLQSIVEDKQSATSPGREDPRLLELLLRDEKLALGSLQSFLDDLVGIGPSGLTALESHLDEQYDTHPSFYSSPWPQVVIPSTSSSNRSFSARLKDVFSSWIKIFKRE